MKAGRGVERDGWRERERCQTRGKRYQQCCLMLCLTLHCQMTTVSECRSARERSSTTTNRSVAHISSCITQCALRATKLFASKKERRMFTCCCEGEGEESESVQSSTLIGCILTTRLVSFSGRVETRRMSLPSPSQSSC